MQLAVLDAVSKGLPTSLAAVEDVTLSGWRNALVGKLDT